MKAVIALILIAGLGFAAFHYQQQARTLAATVTDLGTEAREQKREIDKLEKALEKAEAELEARKEIAEAIPTRPTGTPSAPKESTATGPATTAAPAPNPAAERAAKIAQLEAEYDTRKAEMDTKQAEIDAARQRAQTFIAEARASHPQFSEQSARFDNAGNLIGNKGIRTSQADREKAMALYNQRIAAAEAGMAKVDEEQAKLNAQREAVARQFNEAMDAARR